MREMRKKKRAMPESMALEILKNCEYLVLATVSEDGFPYCIPISPVLHQGYVYFHCATEGHKLDNIRGDARVCLCAAQNVQAVPEKFSTLYDSVVAFGRAQEVTDEGEKLSALRALSEKYAASNMDKFDGYAIPLLSRTCVCKVTLEGISGKSNRSAD